MVTSFVQVVIGGTTVNLEDQPSKSDESWGGSTDATVFVIRQTDFKETSFPCHVELVPRERVEEWTAKCSDLHDWLGWSDGVHTVKIRGKEYVLFITPFAR